MDTIHSSSRLMTYAKDHDRLRLALVSVEDDISPYETELKELKSKEHNLRKRIESSCLLGITGINDCTNKFHPTKYGGSTKQGVPLSQGRPETQMQYPEESTEEGDQATKCLVGKKNADSDALRAVVKRIKELENPQGSEYNKQVARKGEILKSIEELHAAAFDGDTPEFPHEDHLEGLVKAAENALKGEQATFDALGQHDALLMLAYTANEVKIDLWNIYQDIVYMCAKIEDKSQSLPSISRLKEYWETHMKYRLPVVANRCRAWKASAVQYLDEHSTTTLSPDVIDTIPQFEAIELVGLFSRASSEEFVVQDARGLGYKLFNNACISNTQIQTLASEVRYLKSRADSSIKLAEKTLEIRRRQLGAARTQILKHVLDPKRNPIEPQAESLPECREELSIHDSSWFRHPDYTFEERRGMNSITHLLSDVVFSEWDDPFDFSRRPQFCIYGEPFYRRDVGLHDRIASFPELPERPSMSRELGLIGEDSDGCDWTDHTRLRRTRA
ncbi:hypothetical protein RHS02_03338, partial [Rhizoctonia solani]